MTGSDTGNLPQHSEDTPSAYRWCHLPLLLFSRVVARAHKEGYPANLTPPPSPSEAHFFFFQRWFVFYSVFLLGGSFLGCAPVDGLLHTLEVTKRLVKRANIAKTRDVKLYFRLFRYVNPFVNARWSM